MTLAYRVYPEMELACYWAMGSPSLDELLAMAEDLFGDAAWRPGFKLVCDYRACPSLAMGYGQINALAEYDRQRLAQLTGTRLVVIAPADAVYGLGRVWQALAQDLPIDSLVCREVAEAARWLGMDPAELAAILERPPPGEVAD